GRELCRWPFAVRVLLEVLLLLLLLLLQVILLVLPVFEHSATSNTNSSGEVLGPGLEAAASSPPLRPPHDRQQFRPGAYSSN
uniref:Uncharacterized protein n=1 Tax=Globodera pallida TaxID=36090 RepID=A0A183CTL4_GLOPA